MASSRRTRRRRQQKSLHRHQLRLEGLEKRSMLTASDVSEESMFLTDADVTQSQNDQEVYVATTDQESITNAGLLAAVPQAGNVLDATLEALGATNSIAFNHDVAISTVQPVVETITTMTPDGAYSVGDSIIINATLSVPGPAGQTFIFQLNDGGVRVHLVGGGRWPLLELVDNNTMAGFDHGSRKYSSTCIPSEFIYMKAVLLSPNIQLL